MKSILNDIHLIMLYGIRIAAPQEKISMLILYMQPIDLTYPYLYFPEDGVC